LKTIMTTTTVVMNGVKSHRDHIVSEALADRLPYLDLEIDWQDAFEGAKTILKTLRSEWSTDDVKFTVFTDGYTNKLIACIHKSDLETKKDVVLVRIYGPGTDRMIDRNQERQSMAIFHRMGCAAPLYGRFRNGIIYGFSPGVVVTLDLVHQPNVRSLIARMMAQIHTVSPDSIGDCGVKFCTEPSIFRVLNKWCDLIPVFDDESTQKRFNEIFTSQTHLKNEIADLQRELEPLGSPVVLCHNDLLFKNIIYNEEKQKVTFIDFEYVAFNYQAFDIADHFCEFAGMEDVDYSRFPDRDYQMAWLRTYLESYHERLGHQHTGVTPLELETLFVQVNKFVLASHLMWMLWGIIQAKYSTIGYDYMDFAKGRFLEYCAKKKSCLALKLP